MSIRTFQIGKRIHYKLTSRNSLCVVMGDGVMAAVEYVQIVSE